MIVENSLIEMLDDNLKFLSLNRVLWVDPQGSILIVMDITDKKNMKMPHILYYEDVKNDIDNGMAKLCYYDPDLRLLSPEEDYLSRYKEARDANWLIIKDIVVREPEIYMSATRGSYIMEVIEKTGKSKKEIYRLLKRYWFYGKKINGLLRNYFDCGAPGKEREYEKNPGPKASNGNSYLVKDKDHEIFNKAIAEFHIKKKMDLKATFHHMCETYYNSGYYRKHNVLVPILDLSTAPTLRQFLYWYGKEVPFAERYKNRFGKRRAIMDIRPLQGNAYCHVDAVGYLFEIDSTPADIHLVSIDRKTILGTPTLYLVKDVFSRLIVGFHVSCASPSWVEQMIAIENTATNKVEFCSYYGIDITKEDWPCHHLPKHLAGDRGELKGKKSENIVNLNIDVANAPSYRGDLKPFIEQHFRLTNKDIRELLSLAGAKPGHSRERGEKDPARNAALTIYEFIQFMIIQIITFNKSALNKEFFVTKEMFIDEVELTPLGVWNWGNGKSLLHEEPRSLVRYSLLPKENARVTRNGIEVNGMCYTSGRGLKEGWFEEGKIEGNKNIEISFDPRNCSSIFIRLKSGELIQCSLTERYKDYVGLHLEDVKALLRYKKEQIKEKQIEEKQHKAEFHAFSKELVKNAIKETRVATTDISYYERLKDKKAKKKIESRSIGSHIAWTNLEDGDSSISNAMNEPGEVVTFPNHEKLGFEEEEFSEVHKIFSAKNRERRKGREFLE